MILAIDIGGTKTLVALARKNGALVKTDKFPTPASYKAFIKELSKVVANFSTDYKITVVAAPGKIDRKNGVGLIFGNLGWKNANLQKDISAVTKTTVLLENDANLAGLGEASFIKPRPARALYITVSTGIGTGIIVDGKIDPEFEDSEGGQILIEYEDKLTPWEKVASGQAIVARYGKRASEINDPKIWREISKWLALGIIDLSAVIEPDIIIMGGGVGTHFHKYNKQLREHILKMTPKLVTVPSIVPAKKPEEAVIYGCIELAKQYEK